VDSADNRRHEFQPLELPEWPFRGLLWTSPSIIFFFSSSIRFFRRGEFFLNGLQLFVEVVLFLRALHLALHARIDGCGRTFNFSSSISRMSPYGFSRSDGVDVSSKSCFHPPGACKFAAWCRRGAQVIHSRGGQSSCRSSDCESLINCSL